MSSVWQGVQSVLQPHHPQPQALRIQALRMSNMFEVVSEEGRPQKTPGNDAFARQKSLLKTALEIFYIEGRADDDDDDCYDSVDGDYLIHTCYFNIRHQLRT